MKIIRDNQNLSKNWSRTSVTVGNFDSFHEGHLQLIFDCVKYAKRNHMPSVLVSFEPCRNSIFFSTLLEKYTSRTNSLRKRFLMLRELGIDYLFLLKFNKRLISMSATLFIKEIIIQKLGAKIFVIGDDFQFGRMKLGNASLLYAAKKSYSLQIVKKPTFVYKNHRISSSRINFYIKNYKPCIIRSALGKF